MYRMKLNERKKKRSKFCMVLIEVSCEIVLDIIRVNFVCFLKIRVYLF